MAEDRTNPALPRRHGHYAAKLGKRFGDELLSGLAEQFWKPIGHTAPSVVDGVSCTMFEGSDDVRIRTTALNLFDPVLKVITFDGDPWRIGR